MASAPGTMSNADSLLNNEHLRGLYDAGKNWVAELWKDKICDINIERKTVGRNPGFILVVTLCEPDNRVLRYYAKLQDVQLDMVLSHWILKEMKCGPHRFKMELLVSKYGSTQLGIIAEEVTDFLSAWEVSMSPFKRQIRNPRAMFLSEGFILTVVAHLCQFSRIPDNYDNWGLTGLGTNHLLCKRYGASSKPQHRLSIVDFSSYYYCNQTFRCQETFLSQWGDNLLAMLSKCEFRCSENWCDQAAEALSQQYEHFPWLQSKAALLEVLQRACDQTAEWLHTCAVAALADISANAVAVSAFIAAISDPETIDTQEMLTVLERIDQYIMFFLDVSGAAMVAAEGLGDHLDIFRDHWRRAKRYKYPNYAGDYDFGAEFQTLAAKWDELVALTEPQQAAAAAADTPVSVQRVQPTRRAKQAHPEPAKPAKPEIVPCLVAYRTSTRVTDHKLREYFPRLYRDFEERVGYLNQQVDLFSAWFPYPADTHHGSTPLAQQNKRKHHQMAQDALK